MDEMTWQGPLFQGQVGTMCACMLQHVKRSAPVSRSDVLSDMSSYAKGRYGYSDGELLILVVS